MSEDVQNFYKGKMIAAPMVRGSSLTFRLACLEYGADIVFSPGLVDLGIISSTIENENGSYSLYKVENGHNRRIFHTTPEERGKLIVQLISVDGPNAIKAANMCNEFASGIDINCGCPESFANHRGGGSSIQLENAVDIVKTLKMNSPLPVSVKMRVRNTVEESIQFAKAMVDAGASAITVHGRLAADKRHGSVDYDHMKAIFDAIDCAKIGNGGIRSKEDAIELKEKTGCDSIMIASAALKNPSIFANTLSTPLDVLFKFHQLGSEHGEKYIDANFNVQQLLIGTKDPVRALEREISQIKEWDVFKQKLLTYL